MNFEEYVNLISLNFQKLVNSKYNNLVVHVDDEQSFLKRKNIQNLNDLYIVIKFSEATLNFGNSILPITLVAFGLPNRMELTQQVLIDFANEFNLKREGNIQELYTTPYKISGFVESDNSFRALFSLSGTLIIGKDSIYLDKLTYYYGENQSEEIDLLSFNDETTNQMNPQVYGNTFGRTKSYATAQTYSFSISTYNIDSQLIKDVMSVKYGGTNQIDKEFIFSISFYNGTGFSNWHFKLINASFNQKIGEIPVISLGFTL